MMNSVYHVVAAGLLLVAGAGGTRAESFFLRAEGSGKMYGPYAYVNGEQVGEGKNTFTILDTSGEQFSLKSLRTGDVYGPFRYADGARVEIGGGSLVLIKERAVVRGTLSLDDLQSRSVPVYILPVTPKLLKGFYEMRAAFQVLEKRHEARTAARRIGPRVSGPNGHNRTGIVEWSEKEVQKSRESVDRQAMPIYRKFAEGNAKSGAKVVNEGAFALRDLPKGQYLVLAEGTVRNEAGSGGGLSDPAFWWEVITVRDKEAIEIALTGDNVKTWPALFKLILENDSSLGIAAAGP